MTKVLPDAQKDALLANVPVGRLGRPEEIAAAVAFWHRQPQPISQVKHCISTVVCIWGKLQYCSYFCFLYLEFVFNK